MNVTQIVLAIVVAAACSYWQHSAGIIAWCGCCLMAAIPKPLKTETR